MRLFRRTIINFINFIDEKTDSRIYDFTSNFLIRIQLTINLLRDRFFLKFKKNTIELVNNKRKIIVASKHIFYIHGLKNFFNLYFDSLISKKINGYQVLNFSKLKLHTYKKNNLSFYFTSIPEDEWEIEEYLYMYKIKKGDIVFDLGSYCGYSVYMFSKMVGSAGEVYAFEPDPGNYRCLLKNIKLHNLKNVTVVKKGVWSEKGKLSFFKEGNLGSSMKDIGARSKNTETIEVEVVSLEDACKSFKLTHIDFVKMDIEGAEIYAVEGSLNFIKRNHINFAISCHEVNNRTSTQSTEMQLNTLFKKIGYKTRIKKFEYQDFSSTTLYAYG